MSMGNGDYKYPATGVECAHRVAVPPPQPFTKSLKTSLKETFFPDDPLRQFKNQPASRKFILGLQYFFPILEWGPRYSFQFLKADLISGITIASLAIPQGISYAKLANLPPILGLCECHRFWFQLNLNILFTVFDNGYVLKCRFELRSAAGLCYDGELQRLGGGDSSGWIASDSFHAGEWSEGQWTSPDLSSPRFPSHILCWSFSSFAWPSEVMTLHISPSFFFFWIFAWLNYNSNCLLSYMVGLP